MILFWLILFFPFCNATAIDDVNKLLTEFSTTMSTNKDFLVKLGFLGASSAAFVTAAAPVGSLITASLSVALSEDSDELTAIKKLDEGIQNLTLYLNTSIKHLEKLQFETPALNTYYEVLISNTYFVPHLKAICNNRPFNKELKATVFTACSALNSDSPQKSLSKLVLISSCNIPSVQQKKLRQEALHVLNKIGEKMDSDDRTHFNHEKKVFARKVLSMNETKANNIVQNLVEFNQLIVNYPISSANKLKKVTKILQTSFFAPVDCALTEIFESTDERREPIIHFSKRMAATTVKTALYASLCLNITYEKLPFQLYNETMNTYSTFVKTVFENTKNSIESKLKSFWPTEAKEKIKIHIPQNLDESDFQHVARKIQEDFSQRGERGFSYQVAISVVSQPERYYASSIDANHISQAFQNVNVGVFRFKNNAAFRAKRAFNIYDSKYSTIDDTVLTYIKYDQAPDMAVLWSTIQNKTNNLLLNHSAFRHVILMYKYGLPVASSCQITSGNATSTFLYRTQATYNFEYIGLNCEKILIQFFL